ncbi:hypothetical protein F442_10266 [Phytophthora nicotianae P10297]|uniref:Uncharacterized protein n=1 Tax=Phytophthora nicotianae P10297 TaxID=1317064 RepID=W2Z7B8_PHYNI|nr:hypothetical protein F442_10266 [Phytophthora nicotianae P10297]
MDLQTLSDVEALEKLSNLLQQNRVPAPNLCCTRHKVNFSNRVSDEDTQRVSDSSHACKPTLNDELNNIIGNVMNHDIIDIDALFFDQELKLNLREADVKARHELTSTFSTPNGIKEKCKFLKQYLEPAALRDAIDTDNVSSRRS